MKNNKTRPARQRWSGLQRSFDFMQDPISPTPTNNQLCLMGYRIDPQLSVQPIWRRQSGSGGAS